MTTTTSVTCFDCGESGHIRRNCPHKRGRGRKQKTKPAGAAKWCSIHFSTRHSDEECYEQGPNRPEKSDGSGKVFSARTHCNRCSSASNNKEEPAKPYAAGATLLVDTGASETMLDDHLIPGLKKIMREYKQLVKPKAITVAGDYELKGTATGLIFCTVKDNRGEKQTVRLRGLVVPGLGRNIFSPTALMKKGVRLTVEAGNPHLAHTLSEDQVFSKPHTVSGGDDVGVAYAALVNANTWHRRLGHLNSRSMDILRKKDGSGVDYTDSMSPYDICAISKSRQLAHPKKTTRKTTAPMQLVYTDNMGQISPPAKGGFRYVSKFTDDYSRMK
ncbi:unnamed protein product [Ectocarpus sp. 12 AP-2014]